MSNKLAVNVNIHTWRYTCVCYRHCMKTTKTLQYLNFHNARIYTNKGQ